MANEKFSIKEALSYGWDTFKAHAGFFIGLIVVTGLITGILQYGVNSIFESKPGIVVGLLVGLVFFVIRAFISWATIRLTLNVADTGAPHLDSLKNINPSYFRFVLTLLAFAVVSTLASLPLFLSLLGLASVQAMAAKIFIGLLALATVVFSLFVSLMFMFAPFLTVDQGVGPIESLKASRELTQGIKWDLLLFGVVCVGLNLLGLIALVLGLLVTVPVTIMGVIYIYRRLNPAQAAATV